jgi:uncharacterized protein (UPF0335 family)
MSGGSNTPEAGQLRAFIERIEKLSEEKAALADDIKSVFDEAKSSGYDPKVMRKVIAIRKQDKAKREEEEALIDLYLGALGDLKDTPLGQAAVSRAFGR